MDESDNSNQGPQIDLSPADRVDTSFLHVGPVELPSMYAVPESEIRQLNKGDIFKALSRKLQVNEYGLPSFMFRSDLIPADIFSLTREERHMRLEAATVPITWDYGYPAIDDTTPMWERLDWEPAHLFDAFLRYLELPKASEGDNPVRMLPLLSQALGIPVKELADASNTYYWAIRFRAYDLYLIACHQKQREQRIMTIEGKHFTMAENYLKKIDTILGKRLDRDLQELQDQDSSVHDDLKLKDLVDIIQKLTTIQRIAVGIPANGVDQSETFQVGRRNQTTEDAFKEIASHGSPAKKSDSRSASMDQLLSNPDDLAAAQDLIIRASRS